MLAVVCRVCSWLIQSVCQQSLIRWNWRTLKINKYDYVRAKYCIYIKYIPTYVNIYMYLWRTIYSCPDVYFIFSWSVFMKLHFFENNLKHYLKEKNSFYSFLSVWFLFSKFWSFLNGYTYLIEKENYLVLCSWCVL